VMMELFLSQYIAPQSCTDATRTGLHLEEHTL